MRIFKAAEDGVITAAQDTSRKISTVVVTVAAAVLLVVGVLLGLSIAVVTGRS